MTEEREIIPGMIFKSTITYNPHDKTRSLREQDIVIDVSVFLKELDNIMSLPHITNDDRIVFLSMLYLNSTRLAIINDRIFDHSDAYEQIVDYIKGSLEDAMEKTTNLVGADGYEPFYNYLNHVIKDDEGFLTCMERRNEKRT